MKPRPVLSLHLLELKSTFWRAKPRGGEAAGRTDVNQCERSATQGDFVVTGDSHATSLSGDAGRRKSPWVSTDRPGRAGRHVPSTNLDSADATCQGLEPRCQMQPDQVSALVGLTF